MSAAKSKKILVTGGSGFTGSHLVRRLLAQGHEVIALDNQKGIVFDELVALGAHLVLGSVTDCDLIDELMPGVNVVHHLAAAFRQVDLPKEVYWNVNVNGTRYLLEAAERQGVEKFVYCSTCGVHGNVAHPPAAETAPIAPADYYQFTKWQGEKVAHQFMADGMDITILRPAAIYGPDDPERWLMLFKGVARGTFLMFGDGQATYHPLYIDNLIDMFLLAQNHPAARGQTYLVADERYYTLNELVNLVGRVMGIDVRTVHLPFWPLYAAATAVELGSAALHVSPPIFRRRADWYRQNRAFDIGKAQRELGYDPRVGLEAGLESTAAWYKANHYL
jgi:nucleoside-diphosphate-sugar epimerase